jgi:putative membrane protein
MRKSGFDSYLVFLAIIFAVIWCWAAIRPVHPEDWLLENYLVFIAVPLTVVLGLYFRLSNLSYTLITLFMVMHVIGSHYTYAEVPFGETLKSWLGSDRNMYDRLVHFSFGLLLAYPVREIFIRISRVRGFWGFYFPVELTLAFSAIYEIIEWGTAANVDTSAGLAFVGAQGDIWDAQKDMAMAGIGAAVAMIVTLALTLLVDKNAAQEFKESFRIPPDDHPIGERQLIDWFRHCFKRRSDD